METAADWFRQYSARFDRHYAASKLASDPVYEAVAEAMQGTGLPLLDIGCGLGLLAFFLRARGFGFEIRSIDFDARKIDEARRVARKVGARGLSFECVDAAAGLPAHGGNVTVLDVLLYLPEEARRKLLRDAAAAVAPGGCLVIRTGLKADNWRFRATVWADRFARAVRWMRCAPVSYPDREELESVLGEAGLTGTITPLWGRTPFHNHLLVFRRKP